MIGVTATPFTTSGFIYGEGKPFKRVCYQKSIDWMIKNANELADFKKEVKECPFKAVDFPSNIAKCVGIRQLYQNGWLVETWQDIFIDANLETGNFTWKTPVDQSIYDPCGFNYVSSHSSETFKNSPYLSQYKVIVKLMHPWLIKIPEGYDILMLPEPYKEHDTFEMPPGIYPGSFGLQELNTILLWKKQGQTFIPAGTPICQLMLIKSEKHDDSYWQNHHQT